MTDQDEFLAQVAAQLPLPADQRAEILEELAAHVGDTAEDLAAQGRELGAAEAEALARLGSPKALAQALLSARRTRAQVLAAAGAGVWAAIRTGVPGALLGWLLIALAAVLGSYVTPAIGDRLGLPVRLNWSGGWNTVLPAFGLAVGALLAGSAAVRVVARRTWHAPKEVLVAVATGGALIVAFLALVVLESALNWASVLALIAVPLAFVVGAWVEQRRPPTVRIAALLALAGLVVVIGSSLTIAASGGAIEYSWSEDAHGYEMIAPWWQDPSTGVASDFPSGGSYGTTGVQQVTLEAASPAVVGRFHDWRLEAWRTGVPQDGWSLSPGQAAPFATAQASATGTAISGTIAFNRTPGVEWAQIVMTAVGSDGRRYLLSASGPEQTEFYGSVWSWLAAVGH